MTRLILHVGHGKTGTTALQTTLAANGPALLAQGVFYPVIDAPRPHKHGLAVPRLTGHQNKIVQRSTGLSGKELAAMSERYWAQLVAQCQTTPYLTVILSAEEFWAAQRHGDGVSRQLLSAICDQITVSAYVRSPASRFNSGINQRVRGQHAITPPVISNYRPSVEAFRKAGFDQFNLAVFASDALKDGDIVADFLARNLPDVTLDLNRNTGVRSNASVSNEATVLMDNYAARIRAGQKVPHAFGIYKKAVMAQDKAVGNRARPQLKPGIAEAIVGLSDDLHWLRDEMGIVFSDVDYSIAGTLRSHEVQTFTAASQFLALDHDRLAQLDAQVQQTLLPKWRRMFQRGQRPSKPRR